jgi:ParB family chromosome partitioning protein
MPGQEQVYDSLSFNRSAGFIRQAMTQTKVAADDRRVIFIGIEAYLEAGGAVTRDLFTEDRGGWLDDVALVDRLTTEKLAALAEELREGEGWKWAQAHLDYPSGHGLTRVYPHRVQRTEEEVAEIEAMSAEYDAEIAKFDVEDVPPEVEARLKQIEAALAAFGDGYAYAPDAVARGGVFVCLGYDGQARIERGFIRPEDVAPEPEPETEPGDEADGEADPAPESPLEEAEEPDGLTPLSDRLVAELTAYRTASLRDAIAERPEVAFLAVVHALVLRVFYPSANATCLDIRMASRSLGADAPGVEDGPACRRISDRHEAWARQLPDNPDALWDFVVLLDTDSRLAIFAHCVGLSADAVRGWQRRPQALAQAEALATRVGLDMTADWQATGASYLGRVTKARILEAVGEAAGAEAAERLSGLKKPEMMAAAEPLVAETGWLPPLLRTPVEPLPVPLAAE